ncbi:hypothetical protein ATY81_25285 [Rhizobium sp. R72]|uniref:hypothetical protein n=1 Tax=unclassified Rhizobium TaxID=2613769 RepID=UPI000B52EC2C|nr:MULTISPECIES: hypothetical protein [unclassified Rhizobium]OWW00112.1 hypothetical protein ATY81_25285 [Rhizobium sp. R72]OWW00503.1 hypothetical protein ATY80_25285 [Rhizobium sp. R711]
MSSELHTVLKSKDLLMLQDVLDAAGYGSTSNVDNSKNYNAAAKLLLELFLQGVTSEEDLTMELERSFGSIMSPISPPSFQRMRAAIQGRRPR